LDLAEALSILFGALYVIGSFFAIVEKSLTTAIGSELPLAI
jgi:hypothetical protein